MSGLAQAADFDAKRQGAALTQAFYGGQVETVWIRFNEQMRQALGNVEKLAAFSEQIRTQFGAETEVLSEDVMMQDPYEIYLRVVRFEHAPMPFQVQWAFQDDGKVAGFFIKPAAGTAASDYLDYETKTALSLPFEGEWHVVWGGKKIENNYHAKAEDQRFAYDFLIMRDGTSHEGEGDDLTDYYCWGEPILAPGDGTIVTVVNERPDNKPGEMDSKDPAGNYVVIDHGNGEYSFLAHLKQGSATVDAGDEVEAGDTIGLCGNSGNTTEPHLRYHLQTTAEFGQGQGLPAQFTSYIENGEFIERGIPVKGDTVAPADDS